MITPILTREQFNRIHITNVRARFIRPLQLDEWVKIPGNVYIGRARILIINGARFPPNHSPYHNPFRLIACHNNMNLLVRQYREYLDSHPEIIAALVAELARIFETHSGPVNLGCWCAPDPCHGHILLEYIARDYLEQSAVPPGRSTTI